MTTTDPNEPLRKWLREIDLEIEHTAKSGRPGRLFHTISRYRETLEDLLVIGPSWLDLEKAAAMMLWDYGVYLKGYEDGGMHGKQTMNSALATLAGRAARSRASLDATWVVPFPQAP
jgi:hypothetical protein